MTTPRSLAGPGFTADVHASTAAAGAFYYDEDLHLLEQKRVFARSWLYGCHRNEIPEPGDYLVRTIGGESVLLIRDNDGDVRGFYNVCQHRGHPLAVTDGQTNRVLTCPYHAWSYGLDGRLRGAPKSREVPAFCRDDVALSPVAVEVIEAFVLVNLNPTAEPVTATAPSFAPALRSMAAETPSLQRAKTREFEIRANWKIVVENFLEAYHVEFTGPAHRSLGPLIDTDTYRYVINDRTIEYLAAGGPPDGLPYDAHREDDFTNAKGAPFHQLWLYPNTTFSVFPNTNMMFVFVMNPASPTTTAEQIHYFTLDGRLTGPSVSAEEYVSLQLNAEDVQLVESVQQGVSSPGYRPGRLMIDENLQASWSEQFVHHFVSTHLDALADTSGTAVELTSHYTS